jgi:hypothetical protein
MAYPDECDECRALAQELRDAYDDAWASSDRAFRDAWLASYRIIGGTEDDVQRFEELLAALPREEMYSARIPRGFFPRFPRCRDAFGKMALHFARTGHSVGVPFHPPE